MNGKNSPAGNKLEDVTALRRLIADTMGRNFRVLFVSRGRNEAREMRARLKKLEPETVERDKRNHQFTVWDIEKKAYRTIPLERVVLFRCGPSQFLTTVAVKVERQSR